MRLGAALGGEDPAALIQRAKELGASAVQTFLGDPQSWNAPSGYPVEELSELVATSGIDLYIHAPYVINVATTNNKVRIPSRKLLAFTMKYAQRAGAKGVIVHGGHVQSGDDLSIGYANWAKALAEVSELTIPVFIENTAGGERAMARTLSSLDGLWKVIKEFNPGFCLDTCHAHAAGLSMDSLVSDIAEITGGISLVHANGSRDEAGSGRDRHANFDDGLLPGNVVVEVIKKANAPAIIETPEEKHMSDLQFLRDKLGIS